MSKIKYFFQFLFISILFLIFKLIGIKNSRFCAGKIFSVIGPFFRSKKTLNSNLTKAFPKTTQVEKDMIISKMWTNYGKILAEYVFMKNFKVQDNFSDQVIIQNQEVLEKIKKHSEKVVFISGHFNNFELMAQNIEKFGINLAAIYRPLNNIFLNPMMEKIRKNYICKNQIKKGLAGTKELLKRFKVGTSIALMIDQRVSEGIQTELFGFKALTTSIPAQFVKKFNTKIVPVYIERTNDDKFIITFYNPMEFEKSETINSITYKLNKVLEEMILKNPDQWIWTHNRWK